MDMEERGQYITLLCYQHQRGHISEKTIRLLVGNVSDNVLSHFKKDENGLLFNSRMDLEKENRKKFTESRRENGKKGGRPKKNEKTEKKPNGFGADNAKVVFPIPGNPEINNLIFFIVLTTSFGFLIIFISSFLSKLFQ